MNLLTKSNVAHLNARCVAGLANTIAGGAVLHRVMPVGQDTLPKPGILSLPIPSIQTGLDPSLVALGINGIIGIVIKGVCFLACLLIKIN